MRTQPTLTASALRTLPRFALALLLTHCRPPEKEAPCTSVHACGSAGMGVAVTPPADLADLAAVGGGSSGAAALGNASVSGSASLPAMSSPSLTAGTAGQTGGVAGTAGAAPQAGGAGAAGVTAAAGAMAGGALGAAAGSGASVDADARGVALAKPGDSKSDSHEYLNLGDFRILVNKWGSDELKCNTSMRVFVNTDKTFGWSFERGSCGGNKQKPDYPEIEFGIHPFGAVSDSATTPPVSSTSILPLQIKDITSSTVIVDGLNASIQKASTWNIDVEFWLSERNPVTDANPGVYAELIAFWGWQDSWDCDQSGSVTAGDTTYNLCHQSDQWGDGWRYYQLRASTGSSPSYSGKVDIKAFLDWLVNKHGFSSELWMTRIEVGSEIDDNTAGSVTLKDLTFEVNGAARSARFAP